MTHTIKMSGKKKKYCANTNQQKGAAGPSASDKTIFKEKDIVNDKERYTQ